MDLMGEVRLAQKLIKAGYLHHSVVQTQDILDNLDPHRHDDKEMDFDALLGCMDDLRQSIRLLETRQWTEASELLDKVDADIDRVETYSFADKTNMMKIRREIHAICSLVKETIAEYEETKNNLSSDILELIDRIEKNYS